MDGGKKSVILYTEWAQPLKALSLEDKGRIFDAILSYSETGETPHFDSTAAEMAFSFIRLRLDENAQKWSDVRQKRREAGRRGALVTNSKNQQSQTKAANADFAGTVSANVGKSRQSPANPAVNVNVNANVNGNVAAKAAIAQTSPDTLPEQPAAPLLPPSLEENWRELGLGRRMGPVVQQALRAYLAGHAGGRRARRQGHPALYPQHPGPLPGPGHPHPGRLAGGPPRRRWQAGGPGAAQR